MSAAPVEVNGKTYDAATPSGFSMSGRFHREGAVRRMSACEPVVALYDVAPLQSGPSRRAFVWPCLRCFPKENR